MAEYIPPIQKLIDSFRRLPGVGNKTATRYAFAALAFTDEEAEAKIEVVEAKVKRTGKLVEVNLDTICENYENDETVNIESLQDRRVIGKGAGRITVLARGVMTKELTIVANEFSLQAVKMITLAGGHVQKI